MVALPRGGEINVLARQSPKMASHPSIGPTTYPISGGRVSTNSDIFERGRTSNARDPFRRCATPGLAIAFGDRPIAGATSGTIPLPPLARVGARGDRSTLVLCRGAIRLRAEFVCGFACHPSEDVQREHAPESVHEGRCGVGGVFVEVDDRAR